MERPASAVVIGAGMMGPGIAATLANGGVPTLLYARDRLKAKAGVALARQQLGLLRSNGLGTSSAEAPIDTLDDLEAAALTGLVVESIAEDLPEKQALFERLDSLTAATTILASNTSGLSISAIAASCKHPERVLTAHFWNPPHLMPLVEVVLGQHTSPQVAAAIAALLRDCGKTPVLIHQDRPGQLGNRLQMALLREACAIVEEGIASVEDVDLAAKTGFGLRLPVYGIFEHQDVVGLDLGLRVLDYVAADLYNQPQAPELYHRMVAEGKLGTKTSQGFYNWKSRDIKELLQRRDNFILRVISDKL